MCGECSEQKNRIVVKAEGVHILAILEGHWDGSGSVKGLAAKPDDVSSIPRTHMEGGANEFPKVVFWPLSICCGPCPPPKQTNVIETLGEI